jgi:hypothetical protein
LHTTPTVTFEASKPQSAGHCTFCVNQNGAQGGVAGHTNVVPLGMSRLAQKLAATVEPIGSLLEYAMHSRLRVTVLPPKPQSLGHVSGPNDQRYKMHGVVAGHSTGGLGAMQ